MMTLSDPQGRLMCWRLCLMKFEYEILYGTRLVHQVLHSLSCLEQASSTPDDAIAIDERILSFDDFASDASQFPARRSKNALTPTMIISQIYAYIRATVQAVTRRQRSKESSVNTSASPVDFPVPATDKKDPQTTPLVDPTGKSSPIDFWTDTSAMKLPDEQVMEEVYDFLDLMRDAAIPRLVAGRLTPRIPTQFRSL